MRLGSKLVRIYHRGRLIKVHPRKGRGGRSTDPDDYPSELSAYTLRAPDRIKLSAASHGPAVAAYAERLFDGPLALGEDQAGAQAHTSRRTLLCRASGRRLQEGPVG